MNAPCKAFPYRFRWLRLAAGAVALLFAGVIYAWSILKEPLAFQFGWPDSALALNFTITFCFFGVGGIVGSMLSRKTSPRATLLTGAVLAGAGFMGASRISGAHVAALYISYGVCGGLGIGMAYNAVVSTVSAWFPDRRGLSSGIVMMSFGASSLVVGRLAAAMIASPTLGWRAAYLWLGLALLAVLGGAAVFIVPPKPDAALPKPRRAAEKEEAVADMAPGQMLRRASYWKFYIFGMLITAAGSAVISFARDVSLAFGASEPTAITLVGVLAVFNGVGRIVSGLTYDALGRRVNMAATGAASIGASLLVIAGLALPCAPLGVAGLCLTGFAYGGIPTILPAFIGSFYGRGYLAANYSVANTLVIPASFGAALVGLLLEVSGSYIVIFAALAAVSALALALGLGIKRP